MEVMDRINRCKNDEQLYWLTKRLIKEAINVSKSSNKFKGLIGTKLEANPTDYHLTDYDTPESKILYSVDIWNGYIPLGTKIVYGYINNKKNNTISCGGYYYYMDDEQYVYDFVKFIKKYRIEDELDAICAINIFENKYFSKLVNPKKRLEMHKLIWKNENIFFEPIKEHSIKDFYGNGSAQCTEYAAVTNNLFSILGIPISCFYDKKHAYNVLYIETDKEKELFDSYILDFSDCSFIYDEKLHCTGRYPFFKKIENGDREYINDVVNKGKRVEVEDYNMIQINNSLYECKTGNLRNYGVDHDEFKEKKLYLGRK